MSPYYFTGLSYLYLFFVICFLGSRIYQYWQKEKSTLAKLFYHFIIIFLACLYITGLGSLLFFDNSQTLKAIVVIAVFFQSLACAVIGYALVYLKLPRFSPWTGFFIIFILGLGAAILTAFIPFEPAVSQSGAINWDIKLLPGILRTLVYLLTFLPMMVIFIHQMITSKIPEVKSRALIFSSVFLIGSAGPVLEFVMKNYFNLGALSGDIALLAAGTIILILIFFTRRLPA